MIRYQASGSQSRIKSVPSRLWHVVWETVPFFKNVIAKATEFVANQEGKVITLSDQRQR